MNRREFSRNSVLLGVGALAGFGKSSQAKARNQSGDYYEEPAKKLPIRRFDVVITGAGTAGVVAAMAAARQGAKTALIEVKGYPGGTVTEGGTALHSFYNLWKAFPGVKKHQVVRGIPQQIVDRLLKVGGTYGIPYKAQRVKGIENLLACGMMITSNHEAHMSTRNTVCCMGQGQGAGTAAALCAAKNCGTRDLRYSDLRDALTKADVCLEG